MGGGWSFEFTDLDFEDMGHLARSGLKVKQIEKLRKKSGSILYLNFTIVCILIKVKWDNFSEQILPQLYLLS